MISSVQQAGLMEYLILLTMAIGCLLCVWSGRLLRRAMREDEEMGLLEEMGLDDARFLDDCELGRSRIPVAVVFSASTSSKPNNSHRPVKLLGFDEGEASKR
ncbi:hypothetical protein BDQ17DRAFT_1356990 [Cyathus striatus]|nr:hypothetical protein BDQ17DRAFT_1356990 [Cyathus striatus]